MWTECLPSRKRYSHQVYTGSFFLPASHSSTEEQAAVHIASSATRRRLWQLLPLLLMLRNRWKYCLDAE